MRHPALHICALLLACTACGDEAPPKGRTIPIGFIGQFSDKQRISYLATLVRGLNDAGGIELPDGHYDLTLVAEDHQETVEGGVAAMKRLADQGVTATIDPNWSSIILGERPDHSDGAGRAARDLGIVIITGGATSPLITDLDDDGFVWRTLPSDAVQGKVAADRLAAEGITKVATLYREDPYGSGLSGAFGAAFEATGGTIVGTASYPTEAPTELDYRPQLDAIFRDKPEAVMLVCFDEVFTVASQIEAFGYLDAYAGAGPTFFGTDGFYNPTAMLQNFPESVLDHLEGTIPRADKDSDGYRKLAALAAAEGIGEDNVDGARYDALVLIALGMQAAQSRDGAAIRDQLAALSRSDPGDVVVSVGEWAKARAALQSGKTLDYEGASGPIEFDDQGDPTQGAIGLWKVVKGDSGYTLDESVSVPYQL